MKAPERFQFLEQLKNFVLRTVDNLLFKVLKEAETTAHFSVENCQQFTSIFLN